jgi:hypothetical protein
MKLRNVLAAVAVIAVMATAGMEFVQATGITLPGSSCAIPTPVPTGWHPCGYNEVYTAKFYCGNVSYEDGTEQATGLAPGYYETSINIHNPSYSKTTLGLEKKFVNSINETYNPNPRTAITITSTEYFSYQNLAPDAATVITCNEITGIFGYTPVEGFVMIYTTSKTLDVWAAYTTQLCDMYYSYCPSVGTITSPGITVVSHIVPETFTP